MTISSTPSCQLPDLPEPFRPAVGWPTPDTILITKSDWAYLGGYLKELRNWIQSAAHCIEARP